MSLSQSERPAQGSREEVRRIVREFLFGLFLVAVIILGEVCVEHGAFGRWLDWAIYDLIQWRLLSDETHVAVVDISDLKPVPVTFHGSLIEITPRDALYGLLKEIVKQRPLSIGIDIDLSPKDGDFIDANDLGFFKKCLVLSEQSGVPIFLGVYRTESGGPQDWLGDEQFRPLAATIAIPDDQKRITAWLERLRSPETRLPSMSAALAKFRPSAEEKKSWLSWAVEWTEEKDFDANGHRAGEALVDFGGVNAIRDSSIFTWRPEGIAALPGRLTGKMVLIGDIVNFSSGDAFVIPGPGHDKPTPGVLFHACAADTLAGRPLCELTGAGRLVLDALLSVGILGAMTAACLYAIRSDREVNLHLLHLLLNVAAIAVVFIFGVLVVKTSRLIWNDFLLVIAAIALHRPFERLAHFAIQTVRRLCAATWNQLFPQKKKEGQG